MYSQYLFEYSTHDLMSLIQFSIMHELSQHIGASLQEIGQNYNLFIYFRFNFYNRMDNYLINVVATK